MLECLLTLVPWIEGRYSIPICVLRYNCLFCFIFCTLLNLLIPPIVWFFLKYLHPFFYDKIHIYKKFYDFIIKFELRKRKITYFGLFVFTLIPIPFSGAYSASLISFLFNLDLKKAYIAIALGVIAINFLVTLISCTLLILPFS